MIAVFFKSKVRWARVAGSLLVLTGFLFLSSCFNISSQEPCACAINASSANTPAYNPEQGQKCDEYEATLSDADRAEWQRQMSACLIKR